MSYNTQSLSMSSGHFCQQYDSIVLKVLRFPVHTTVIKNQLGNRSKHMQMANGNSLLHTMIHYQNDRMDRMMVCVENWKISKKGIARKQVICIRVKDYDHAIPPVKRVHLGYHHDDDGSDVNYGVWFSWDDELCQHDLPEIDDFSLVGYQQQ